MAKIQTSSTVYEDSIEYIQMSGSCGFCNSGAHGNCCVQTTPFWNRVFICGCGCEPSSHTVRAAAPAKRLLRDAPRNAEVDRVASELLTEIRESDEVQAELAAWIQ